MRGATDNAGVSSRRGVKARGMVNRDIAKRIAVITALLGLVVVFILFGLERYFTLAYIKASQVQFATLYADHPFMVIAAYLLIYILLTSLSLPGAALMTLAGGAMFGLLMGVILVSFASTIGATAACVVSRFLLRAWVQEKFGASIKRINEGIGKEGAFYLFSLRLIPVVPFWLINLAMGVTNMKLSTFAFVSQIGMLAGTIVYVNAGAELSKIDSLKGILSFPLIGAFVLLGIFPLAAKRIIRWYRIL
jgi:uncharacterized membrane protein YdjX (TVP38/TMEM64 family)